MKKGTHKCAVMKGLANKSMEELLILAEHDPEAQFQLGMNYARGTVVRQDWKKCGEWSRRAAAQGYEPAINRISELHPQTLSLLAQGERGEKALLNAVEQIKKSDGT